MFGERNRCRHMQLVREWALNDGATTKLQHCDTCNAIRILQGGKWKKWRRLPINAQPAGPGVVIRVGGIGVDPPLSKA